MDDVIDLGTRTVEQPMRPGSFTMMQCNTKVFAIRYKCTKCPAVKFRREYRMFLTHEELAEIAFFMRDHLKPRLPISIYETVPTADLVGNDVSVISAGL